MLATLRSPRYLGLFAIMVVMALGCSLAGTWQIFRYQEKHAANHHLRSDDGDHPQDVSAVLGPASKPASNGHLQQFRHVTATGTYLTADQTLLRGQTVNDDIGYVVLTPLQTKSGVLLVARGFVQQTAAAAKSPAVAAAPSGTVTVTARLEPSDVKPDRFGTLPGSQVDTVDPSRQASHLGVPVWNAYAELLDGQPGTTGLTVIPNPDLSNPAGGAEEPQHLAYVFQWYLFALLALAAPFIMAAAELRRENDDEIAPADNEAAPGGTPVRSTRSSRKASLDDRLAGKI